MGKCNVLFIKNIVPKQGLAYTLLLFYAYLYSRALSKLNNMNCCKQHLAIRTNADIFGQNTYKKEIEKCNTCDTILFVHLDKFELCM